MKVLVALDRSPMGETAVASIADWAQNEDHSVVLFSVINPHDIHESVASAPPHTIVPGGTTSGQRLNVSEPAPRIVEDRSQALARAHADGEQHLRALAQRLLPGGRVETEIEVNENVANAVVAKAASTGADLVVMSTRSRGGLGRALLGSVTARVVHDSPVPVVLVGPAARKLATATPADTSKQAVAAPGAVDAAQAAADRERALSSASVDQLIEWLSGDDWQLRRGSRLELTVRGDEASAALINALQKGGTETRLEAARALRDIADPSAVPALVAAMEDINSSTRWTASEALISIGQPAIRPVLRELINKSDSVWMQEGAHRVLQHLVNPTTSPVVNALEGPYPSITVPPLVHEALKAIEIEI
jgi:nucleotide-binding universal stress UspA family protein